ncbi:DUF551 domain-containing protein [Klebsiella pneumoniae]|nr:DUF551 domain-containing protein [Klebsiella pneumoniae]
MTDITELAQRMKAAAVRAKTATEEYASGHMSVSVCFAECEEFNRLTDGPDNIIALVEALEKAQQRIDELEASMALAAMDSEHKRNPVLAYADSYRDMAKQGVESVPIWSVITDLERNIAPLYRHAQPVPVVPDDVLAAIQKVARIRLDLNGFDGDRRGIADCLGNAEEALIEVVNRCAAMLAAAPQSPGSEPATVPGKWIPVCERVPTKQDGSVFLTWNGQYIGKELFLMGSFQCLKPEIITHWMPLPAAPQEVNHG